MAKSRVLITGAWGYIGGRIAQAIAKNTDYQVLLASSRKRAVPDWLPEAEVIQMDVMEPPREIHSMYEIDAIVHLASINNYESVSNPVKAIEVNTIGTMNMLKTAQISEIKKFIYMSTIHVYGSPLEGHIIESSKVCPTHPYSLSHAVAEQMVMKENGIVLRSSNGYGCPAHNGVSPRLPLVNALCYQAMQKRQMTLTGGINQKRNFITLHDIGRAVVHCLNDKFDRRDRVFNLAGSETMSILDMANVIAHSCDDQYGYSPELILPEFDEIESPDFLFDGRKFEKTGFKLQGNMTQEIKNTLALWRKEDDPFQDIP